jgi:hypothetical protein
MDKPKGKSPPRRKRPPRRPKTDPVYYVVAIEDGDWGFWFGVSNMPERNGPYDDYRHLNLRGRLLRPAQIQVRRSQAMNLSVKRADESSSAARLIELLDFRAGKCAIIKLEFIDLTIELCKS